MALLEALFNINFIKANTKFCLSLYYNADNSLLMKNKSLNLKLGIKMLTFQLSFALEFYLMDSVLASLEIYL